MTLALALAAGSSVLGALAALRTKSLVGVLPYRQLIGPLFLLNALVALPFALAGDWSISPRIALLHVASIAVLGGSTIGLFALYVNGSASATMVATALSPVPAFIAAALLLGESATVVRIVAASLLSLAVVLALPGAFGTLGNAHAAAAVAVVAVGAGLLTVLGAALVDAGAGIFETYVVRTLACGIIFTLAAPPRGIPVSATPALLTRAALMSGHYLLALAAATRGSAALTQTVLATVPLVTIAGERLTGSAHLSRRTLACAAAACVAVVIAAVR